MIQSRSVSDGSGGNGPCKLAPTSRFTKQVTRSHATVSATIYTA